MIYSSYNLSIFTVNAYTNIKITSGFIIRITNQKSVASFLTKLNTRVETTLISSNLNGPIFIVQRYLNTVSERNNQLDLCCNRGSEHVKDSNFMKNSEEANVRVTISKDEYRQSESNNLAQQTQKKMEEYNRLGDYRASSECFETFIQTKGDKQYRFFGIDFFNIALTAFLRMKMYSRLVDLYTKIKQNRVKLDISTYNIVLKSYFEQSKWNEINELKQDIITYELKPNKVTYFLYIRINLNQNNDKQAMSIFNNISQDKDKHPLSFSNYHQIIVDLCAMRKMKLALKVYETIIGNGIKPTEDFCITLLRGLFSSNLPLIANQLYKQWKIKYPHFKSSKRVIKCIVEGMIINREYSQALNYLKVLRRNGETTNKDVEKIWNRLFTTHFTQKEIDLQKINTLKRYLADNFNLPKSCMIIDIDVLVKTYLIAPEQDHSNSQKMEMNGNLPLDSFFEHRVKPIFTPTLSVFNALAQTLSKYNMDDLNSQLLLLAERELGSIPLSIYNIMLKKAFQVGDINIVNTLLAKLEEDKVEFNTMLYSTIINGYCFSSEPKKALLTYRDMRLKNYPRLLYPAIKVIKLSRRLKEVNFMLWIIKDTLGYYGHDSMSSDDKNCYSLDTTLSETEIELFISKLKALKSPTIDFVLLNYDKLKLRLNGDITNNNKLY
ncbi:hypothetical protein K502DRAFT_322792 [Neoconidiobolus thromboides FSU 785]|nr:hypothetical protein K502DRAFT_322792 [Neoconidiobolus thromboides FSU 785]